MFFMALDLGAGQAARYVAWHFCSDATDQQPADMLFVDIVDSQSPNRSSFHRNEGPLNVARRPEAQALISALQRREKVCPREKIGASEWKMQIISVQALCTA